MPRLHSSAPDSSAGTTHVSVVVPVYNNAETLDELVNRSISVFRGCCERKHELCLVDDGSADNSWLEITRLADKFPEVSGLRLSRNFGQHAAISAGIAHVSGDMTCLMDADLEHRPEDLPALLSEMNLGADLVVAVAKGDVRRRSSDVFQRVFGRLAKSPVHPKALTYRVMNRPFKEALLEYDEFDVVLGPLMSSMGYSQHYVPVERSRPVGRRTSYSLMKRLSLALRALLVHATFIPTLLGWFAVVAALGFFAYALVILGQFIVFGSQLPSGITLLLLVTLASSAMILGALGFVSYIGLGILREVKRRPRFHVEQVVGAIRGD